MTARLVWLGLILVAGGCLDRPGVMCETGLVCPDGTTCNAAGDRCIAPNQRAACDGLAAGDTCSLDGVGGECSADGVCIPLICGDGVRSLTEQCDGADFGDDTCRDYGYYGEPGLACNPDCTVDKTGCEVHGFCMDGVLAPDDEACDGLDFPGAPTCEDFGFYAPQGLACTNACTFDINGCKTNGGGSCGDGVLQASAGEICDGRIEPDQSCVVSGTDFGHVACQALTCTLSMSACKQFDWLQDQAGSSAGFLSVWGSRPNRIFVVGTNGAIRRWDGGGWSAMNSGTSEELQAVWGSSDTNVFATGNGGTVLHYDGTSWSRMSVDGLTNQQVYAIDGTSATNVYAVGNAVSMHYDGARWQPTNGFRPTGMYGLSVQGENDVYAITLDDLWHYDGTAWSVIPGKPAGHTLASLWVLDATHIYMTSSQRSVLRYDGAAWSDIGTPTQSGFLREIWGTSADDIYATSLLPNGIFHYDGRQWTKLVGTPDKFIYDLNFVGEELLAVGEDGTIARFDGTVRTPIELSDLGGARAVWGTAANNVYAASGHSIQRFDGARWSVMTGDVAPDMGAIVDIAGTSASNIVVVTGNAEAYRYNGASWSPMTVEDPRTVFNGLWVASATNMYGAVLIPPEGGQMQPTGDVARFDGTAWRRLHLGLEHWMNAVWGASANDVYVVGAGGDIVHFDGSSWAGQGGVTTQSLNAVWGASGRVFAVGDNGVILTTTGNGWTAMSSGTGANLHAIWGRSASDVYAAGNGGAIVHYDGVSWSPVASPSPFDISDLWGVGANAVFGVGGHPAKLFEDGTRWAASAMAGTHMSVLSLGSDGTVVGIRPGGDLLTFSSERVGRSLVAARSSIYRDVQAFDGGSFIAVGTGGVATHFDGTAQASPATPSTADLNAVWGAVPSAVFAVGAGGAAMRWDGTSWSALTTGSNVELHAVHGSSPTNVFAAGAAGTVLHFDGTSWTSASTGTTATLRGIFTDATGHAVAVGDGGVAVRFDGTAWELLETNTTSQLRGLAGSAVDDLLAVGDGGLLLHFDGSTWAPVRTQTDLALHSVDVRGSSVVYGGDQSMVRALYRTKSWAP